MAQSDNNIKFNELCNLLIKLDFLSRIRGSHYIYFKQEIDEIVNIQEVKNHAKPYQVKQIRELILKYNLQITENE